MGQGDIPSLKNLRDLCVMRMGRALKVSFVIIVQSVAVRGAEEEQQCRDRREVAAVERRRLCTDKKEEVPEGEECERRRRNSVRAVLCEREKAMRKSCCIPVAVWRFVTVEARKVRLYRKEM